MAVIHALRRVTPVCLGFGMGALSCPALAEADPDRERRERIEVTGSHIRRVDFEGPAPVLVITREQIDRSGVSDVAALLREIPVIAGGGVTDFNAALGFQRGNQAVSLRGLGPVATLVLLNGRRMPVAPYADPGTAYGNSFNLNAIPLSAIERIEVLKDGASAIYGSDAIAGVVNIILRRDFRGGEATWSHWQHLDNFDQMNYRAEQLSGAIGYGDLARDSFNAMFVADYYKRYPQSLYESGSGVRNDDYRRLQGRLDPLGSLFGMAFGSTLTFPGNMRRETVPGSGVFLADGRLQVDPRCPEEARVETTPFAECRWDVWRGQEIVSRFDRAGLMGMITVGLGSRMQGFLEAGFTSSRSEFTDNPPALTGNVTTWMDRRGELFRYGLTLPAGHPDNPYPYRVGLFYRFADLGNTRIEVRNDWSRIVAGMHGSSGTWDWESAILFSESTREDTSNGLLHFPTLSAAIANGTYRFNGNAPNSQALLDSLHANALQKGKSQVTSWDFRGNREAWAMPHGPALLAAGFEARRERMDIVSDPRCDAAEFIGVCSSTVHGTRDSWSAYGELSIPLRPDLEGQLAARYDHYSRFGGAATPKVGFKWTATDTIAVRGTWGLGFRAPSLFQAATSNVAAFANFVVDPLRCPDGATPAIGADPTDCFQRVATVIQANPALKPEKSSSYSFGLILSPARGLSLSFDRWYVMRKDFIDKLDPSVILRNELAGEFAGGTSTRDPRPETWLPGVPNSGPVIAIVQPFNNFGATGASGLDFSASARWNLPSFGRMTLEGDATYYDKLVWKLNPNGAYISGLGNYVIFESPRFRARASLVWEYQAISLLARYSYTGGWDYGQATQDSGLSSGPFQCYPEAAAYVNAFGRCSVDAFETWDVGASWSSRNGLRLSLLVRNVTDKAAPYDPGRIPLGFGPVFHNPYGRYLQFSLTYRFK